jgi:hypothetical protein
LRLEGPGEIEHGVRPAIVWIIARDRAALPEIPVTLPVRRERNADNFDAERPRDNGVAALVNRRRHAIARHC